MTPLAKKVDQKRIVGKGYVGQIKTNYNILVEKFGKPGPGDGYKISVEWVLEFTDGTIAAIYDWKIGIDYLGAGEGILPKDNKLWNIGGGKTWAAVLVHAVVKEPTVRKVKIRLLKDGIRGIQRIYENRTR